MLEPVELTSEFKNSYYDRINLSGSWKLKDMRDDPVKFAKFMIGITPRDYQAFLFDMLDEHQRVAIVKGRQIGFTTALALWSLWAVWFNKYPGGVDGKTKVELISKDEEAAKSLLQQVKDFMYMGDSYMSAFLKGKKEHSTQVFSREIIKNNVDELKLKNGCTAYSFPPTKKARGKSPTVIVLDEFAFMNNPDMHSFFYTDVLPSTVETKARMIISSTPNGYGDLFYDLVDPEDKLDEKSIFTRFMFPYTLNKSENYIGQVEELKLKVDDKQFKQEYMCSFEENDVSFFNGDKVKGMFDPLVEDLNPDNFDLVCGVDYGKTKSRTVITLSGCKDGVIYRFYYKEFPSGWDINGVIPFITGLKDRYRIVKVVPDDCPMGDAVNNRMVELGWNVELFNFGFKDNKTEKYCSLRNRLNKGEVRMLFDRESENQFLSMKQEELQSGKLRVFKPRNGKDDIVDGLLMASSQFLDVQDRLGVYFV